MEIDSDGFPSEVQKCTRCGSITDDWAYEPIGYLKGKTDYIYDYDSILCPTCYDDRCTKYNIGPLR